jgi:glycogen debranching enzyme
MDNERILSRLEVREDGVYISRGDTVLATDHNGFIAGGRDRGLFVHQTRLASHYRVLLRGRVPFRVAASSVRQDRWLGYYIVPAKPDPEAGADGTPQAAAQHTVELRVARAVGDGMHEDLDLANYSREEVTLRLSLEIDADFADIEETKGERRQEGTLRRTWRRDGDTWELGFDYSARHRYERQGERGNASIRRILSVRINCVDSPPVRAGGRIHFDVTLPPRGRWHACLDWVATIDGRELECPGCPCEADEDSAPSPLFMREATTFSSPGSRTLSAVVVGALDQARHDLAALRLARLDQGERAWTVAAGVPMFVALYGRDSCMVAMQAALLGPELLRGTLPLLARWQGTRTNDWRDEQPGRILHEAQTGPLAQLGHSPKALYYGSLTSSALLPLAVSQLWNWTGDRAAVAPLLEPAMKALGWLDRHAREDRGFYACTTRSKEGLENQTWKDSSDAIPYADGETVPQPVATCEEQGLVYQAKLALAAVLVAHGRKDDAERLRRDARELRQRFNDAYWMDDADFFAMALDPQGRQVRSIGSNAMHAISTGIADPALVPRLCGRLFADDLFTGWGIRTLSSQHAAYNPYAYHRGSVWPVEHGTFALGAARAGLHDAVARICRAQFETAGNFEYFRLPECFSGHPRNDAHPFPAIYPAANAPQAWSSSTVVVLLQALLGLQPYAADGLLLLDPHLPDWLPEITLDGLRVGDAVARIRFRRGDDGRTRFDVLDLRGALRIVAQAHSWDWADAPERRIAALRAR